MQINALIYILLLATQWRLVTSNHLIDDRLVETAGKALTVNRTKTNISFKLSSNFFPLDINQYNNIVNIEQSYIEERRLSCSLGRISISVNDPVRYSHKPAVRAYWEPTHGHLFVFNTEFEVYRVDEAEPVEPRLIATYPELTSFVLSNVNLRFSNLVNGPHETAQILLIHNINSICVFDVETGNISFIKNSLDESNVVYTFISDHIGGIFYLNYLYSDINGNVKLSVSRLDINNLPLAMQSTSYIEIPQVTLDYYETVSNHMAICFFRHGHVYIFIVSHISGLRGFLLERTSTYFNLNPISLPLVYGHAIYKIGSIVITYLNDLKLMNSSVSVFRLNEELADPFMVLKARMDINGLITEFYANDTRTVLFSTQNNEVFELNIDIFLVDNDELFSALFSDKYATKKLNVMDGLGSSFQILGSFATATSIYAVFLSNLIRRIKRAFLPQGQTEPTARVSAVHGYQ